MRYLLDTTEHKAATFTQATGRECGQLLTPLTRFARWTECFAIDNGCFAGFRRAEFGALLKREEEHSAQCLFVTCPDVVASGRRTLELWQHRREWIPACYRVALVSQDGMENLDIPWSDVDAIFVGGGDPWKESAESIAIVRAAKILGKHVHVGRVNTQARYDMFAELGCDTCDGSGMSRFPESVSGRVFGAEDESCVWDSWMEAAR